MIHPSAIVEDGAVIGEGTKVWHHTHVRTGARVGEGCVLGKNVFVDADVFIGDRCKIQNNVSVFRGVELGDDVFVGPSVVFTNDLLPRANATELRVIPTSVGEGASIGANATVICGNKLGPWSMVAAGAVVTHDVGANELVGGNPARRMGWVCQCGLILSKTEVSLPETTCDRCGSTTGPVW